MQALQQNCRLSAMRRVRVLFVCGAAVLSLIHFGHSFNDSSGIARKKSNAHTEPTKSGHARPAETNRRIRLQPPATLNSDSFLTPRQLEFTQQQLKAELDRQFEAQPINSIWQIDSERILENSLGADASKEVGEPSPEYVRIECRGNMCRIILVNKDTSDAGLTTAIDAIADRMPYTQTTSRIREDGGIEYFIYAQRDRPSSIQR